MNHLLNPNGRFEIFNYQNLGKVRVQVDSQGNPWFCLNDVIGILQLSNSRMVADRINDPYVRITYVGVQTGVKQDGTPAIQNVPMNFVSEAGLYQAIGRSRKPEAQVFMNWVFGEVLPMIRRTGMYIDEDTLKDLKRNPTIIGNMIVNYENKLSELRNENETLQNKIKCYDSYSREQDDNYNEFVRDYDSLMKQNEELQERIRELEDELDC